MPNQTAKNTILFLLREAGEVYPHQRLGQIIVNAMNVHCPDLFYIEDGDLINRIGDYISESGRLASKED